MLTVNQYDKNKIKKGVSKFQILEILTAILIRKNAMTDNNIGNCNINYLSSTCITSSSYYK